MPNRGVRSSDRSDRIKDNEPIAVAPDYPGRTAMRAGRDPAVHALCIRIAKRCVNIIQTVLRNEEVIEAQREFYRVCREELDKPPGREREV